MPRPPEITTALANFSTSPHHRYVSASALDFCHQSSRFHQDNLHSHRYFSFFELIDNNRQDGKLSLLASFRWLFGHTCCDGRPPRSCDFFVPCCSNDRPSPTLSFDVSANDASADDFASWPALPVLDEMPFTDTVLGAWTNSRTRSVSRLASLLHSGTIPKQPATRCGYSHSRPLAMRLDDENNESAPQVQSHWAKPRYPVRSRSSTGTSRAQDVAGAAAAASRNHLHLDNQLTPRFKVLAVDLLNPSPAAEAKKHKLKV